MIEARLPLWKQAELCNKGTNMVRRFGTWNVRTLLQAGNMNIIAKEAERYKMEGELEGDHGRDGLQSLKKICK